MTLKIQINKSFLVQQFFKNAGAVQLHKLVALRRERNTPY